MVDWALITGASSGLGASFARQLAPDYNLILTARNASKLNLLRKEILDGYPKREVKVILGDLGDEDFRSELSHIIENTENFSYLVNNAGFGLPDNFIDVPIEKHLLMIDLHVTAVTELIHASLGVFENQNRGTIINVASVAAFTNDGVYGGTKNYQLKLSRRIKKYIDSNNLDISIQVLCPGFTKTNFHYTEEFEHVEIEKRVPKWLWLDKDKVVEESIEKARKKKLVVVPSYRYKLIVLLAKIGLISR